MFITIKQLAERWAYAPDTIYKGIKKNPDKWPPYTRVGEKSKILFNISDVEDFENKRNTKKS